jgi:hypothetical protein
MPKVVMEKLGLEITRPYHDLYSFDARKVKCDGLIKDMVVTLAQLPVKSIMMDVVVVDVPANYEMLSIQDLGKKYGRYDADGHDLCYCASFWRRK